MKIAAEQRVLQVHNSIENYVLPWSKATPISIIYATIFMLLCCFAAPVLLFAQGNAAGKMPPVYSYRIINVYPHDTEAFTQGLVYVDNVLFEGTGLNGKSSLRKVDLSSGDVLQFHELDHQYFGEGVTVFQNRIIQLTWQGNVGFSYDREQFILLEEFYYPMEGWGITTDGEKLFVSDGTENIYLLDPYGFHQIGQIAVTENSLPVKNLNELEYINGEIYANVLPSDRIARIDPKSGEVLGWIDLSGLLASGERRAADILNGIAYDPDSGHLFVTGKLWPKLFEVEVVAE